MKSISSLLSSRWIQLFTVILVIITQQVLPKTTSAWAAQQDPTKMYYYFPDSPHVNLVSLKKEVEKLFSNADFPVNFQPFSHLADLENRLKEESPSFLLVPAGYAKHYQKKFHVSPILHAARNGSVNYEKVLLYSSKLNLETDNLAGKTLAMTRTDPDFLCVLDKLSSNIPEMDCSKIRVINVPKDADAIFALTLGQVDLALVSKINLKMMRKLSPHLEKHIKQFPRSLSVSMPVLCAIDGKTPPGEIAKLSEILLSDQIGLANKINLGVWHINGWQAFLD